ncbi:class I SAM-dependent methyltransferase [Nocardioides sp. Kera G14]|uniref:class I SAM-dependent methyltransferase n=1 Tax=Nocardioides sp. Kera G14 TaxID=2884264 RepID=UPI001D12E035|nr:class I SAM-dependent methyltransferase [Nocardioides sp. Kera G14]UDY23621.1 class I SAM-dependent methyltransferase [Nocardioides sp. Kera G14]
MPDMPTTPVCPVCSAPTEPFDTNTILGHRAEYSRCRVCGLVTIHDTPWLEEAYSSAIHSWDSGLLRRAQTNSRVVSAAIRFEGIRSGPFLDWAGGYGVFAQLLRDRGYDCYQHDDYATPVFASAYPDDGVRSYQLITAFEVLEHLADPVSALAELAARTDRMLFTTELLPDPAPRADAWWYYLPGVGQHITFHTEESLRRVAEQLGYRLTSNGANWHFFHRGPASLGMRTLLSPAGIGSARRLRELRRELLARAGR